MELAPLNVNNVSVKFQINSDQFYWNILFAGKPD